MPGIRPLPKAELRKRLVDVERDGLRRRRKLTFATFATESTAFSVPQTKSRH
jgi:hypothetical protein